MDKPACGEVQGWAPLLSSLKTLLETGRPLPEMQRLVERGRPTERVR